MSLPSTTPSLLRTFTSTGVYVCVCVCVCFCVCVFSQERWRTESIIIHDIDIEYYVIYCYRCVNVYLMARSQTNQGGVGRKGSPVLSVLFYCSVYVYLCICGVCYRDSHGVWTERGG